MQKVAWPTTTVNRLRSTPSTCEKVELSAIPVTIPGRAIGRITRKEIVSRPKKRCRATASDARVPRTSATAVASSPTLTEVQKASRAPGLPKALSNHSSVKPGGGQSSVDEELNA